MYRFHGVLDPIGGPTIAPLGFGSSVNPTGALGG